MANNYSKLYTLATKVSEKVKSENVNWATQYHMFFTALFLIKEYKNKSFSQKILNDKEYTKELDELTNVLSKYKFDLDFALSSLYFKMNNSEERQIIAYLTMKKTIFSYQKYCEENNKVVTFSELINRFIASPAPLVSHFILDTKNAPSEFKKVSQYQKITVIETKKLIDFINESTDEVVELKPFDIPPLNASSKKTDDSVEEETASTSTAQSFDADILSSFRKVAETPAVDTTTSTKKVSQSPKVNEHFLSKLLKQTKQMQQQLRSEIFGQDYAIKSFITGYFRSEIFAQIHKNRNKPRATFLFAGAPGVGKTFLAESVAKILNLPYKRFDMSEYADKEANIEFCGSDKVYKNGKAGNVTEFVEKNPKCVLLFDEVEKCHQTVTYLFLQMLDAGRLRDNFTDNEVSFTDAIIIFTTNAGKQLYENNDIPVLADVSRKVILQALSEDINPVTQAPLFPRAICSRFASGNIVVFNNLNTIDLIKIIKGELYKNAIAFKKQFKTDIIIDEDVASILLFAEGGKTDARTIKSRAGAFFNDELYELLRLITRNDEDTSINALKKVKIQVQLPKNDKEITELFVDSEKPEVLVCASEETFNSLSVVKGVKFIRVDNVKDAEKILDTHRITMVLSDIMYGGEFDEVLNLEDSSSQGRKLITLVNEEYDIPLYILDNSKRKLTDEEIFSFTKYGIYGVFSDEKSEHKQPIKDILDECKECYRQKSLQNLSKENKVITYSTSQQISQNGEVATINLFNFNAKIAVDAKDSNALLCSTEMPNVTFDDIIGANDAKDELKYFIQYLKKPSLFISKGVKQPKGVLLYGPPGTGKTMLAKAMAKEAGVTFIAAEGNEFIKRYSGEGPEKIHEIFRLARKYAPAILFIDEIDVIAKSRDGAESVSSDVLTALLTELDGFKENKKPIFLLAATNYSINSTTKCLDPAIVRRFDRSINVDLPTKAEREQYITMKIKGKKLFKVSKMQIENISQRAIGMSLAELEAVIEMSLRNAIRLEKDFIDDADFEEAFESYNNGEVKKWDLKTLERTARHEAGHAVVCAVCGEMPSYITIVSRGDFGGYMQHANEEDKFGYTKKELLGKIATALGGRAAELVYYGKDDGLTTGASGDLRSATYYAKNIICTYGMSEEFGLSTLYGDENTAVYTELRLEVNKILNEQLQAAIKIIEDNKEKVDKLVKTLLEKNNLKENEIKEILG